MKLRKEEILVLQEVSKITLFIFHLFTPFLAIFESGGQSQEDKPQREEIKTRGNLSSAKGL